MDLRQLRYFAGIVEAGSLTAAAERLHVAQSALSQHIRRLEEELGVKLLIRSASGVRPTAAGLKLADHARDILGQVKAAERDVRAERGEPSGTVTIGIPAGVGRVLNAPLLDAARKQLPGITLQIVEVLPTHVRDWLNAKLIKLGIIYDLGGHENGGEIIAEEAFYLVSGSAEPGCEDGVTLEALRRFPLIMPTCSYKPKHCIVTYAEQRGISLEVESRVDSLATILDLTINQPGRAVLSPGSFLPEWRAGRLFAYPIVPQLRRSVLLVAEPDAAGHPAVQAIESLVPRVAAALIEAGAWPLRLPMPSPFTDDRKSRWALSPNGI